MHQNPEVMSKIGVLSPTLSLQHNDVTNITGVISSLHLFSKWICHYLTSRPYPDLFKALTNLAGGQQEFTIFSFSRSLIKTAEMTIKGQTRAKLRNSNAFLDYEMKFLQRILISSSKSRLWSMWFVEWSMILVKLSFAGLLFLWWVSLSQTFLQLSTTL